MNNSLNKPPLPYDYFTAEQNKKLNKEAVI